MYRILFVCSGNICRSPTAEGFFRYRLAGSPLEARVETDSAGTHGYHVGSAPDERAISTARGYGVDLSQLCARRVTVDDFHAFDLVLAMDDSHHRALERLRLDAGDGAGRLALMMDYATRYPDVREVPDPYYGSERDFAYMCELIDDATRGLLARLEDEFGGG